MKSHSNSVTSLAAGVKALNDGTSSFAHTQAMWRFLSNDRVTLPHLAAPLVDATQEGIRASCDEYGLVIHDWSRLAFRTHKKSKRDIKKLSHEGDMGYDLATSLVVSDRDGQPIGVPVQNLVTNEGIWTSREEAIRKQVLPHLDELTDNMEWLKAQNFAKPLVHLIDREADSVDHWRRWDAAGMSWLSRIKSGSKLTYQDKDMAAQAIAKKLTFSYARDVVIQGKPARQYVAEAQVMMTRKAKPCRKKNGKKRREPMPNTPAPARLIVSRVEDSEGKSLAVWYLLAKVCERVPAERLALWYYWRWSIESFFKLMKQAGHQLEQWEQETALAIFKRLLIAAAACINVWALMRTQKPEAKQACEFLVRLSGRQMKRAVPITASALLDGIFKLLTLLETLENYSIQELQSFAQTALRQLQPAGYKDV